MKEANPLIAAIDLGSNSFHLAIVNQNGVIWQPLFHQRAAVRLRAGLSTQAGLDPQTAAYALEVITAFAEHLAYWQPTKVKIVATAAFRQFPDTEVLLRQAEAILQNPIEILSGEKEAKCIFEAVAAKSPAWLKSPAIVVDIGGGSTELIIAQRDSVHALESLDMGGISLSEQFFPQQKISPEVFDALIQHCELAFRQLPAAFFAQPISIGVATSGVAEAMMIVGEGLQIDAAFTLSDLLAIQAYLYAPDWQILLQQLGLSADRTVIFPAGLGILIALMRVFSIDYLYPSSANLREGILLQMLNQSVSESQAAASNA